MTRSQRRSREKVGKMKKFIKIPRLPCCQECGSGEVIPIIYGMPFENLEKPGKDLYGAEKKGYVELGGCCIDANSPNYKCKSCGAKFKR